MTTITIDDELATRLRALRGEGNDLNAVVADVLAETARRWEWEASGRAEMKKMLDGPRRPFDPQATYQRYREQYGWTEDLSHLSNEELEAQGDAFLDALPPEKLAEARRLGLI